jgi:hypothetical protein
MGEVIVASKPLPGTGIWASDPLLVRNLTALAIRAVINGS